MDCRQTESLLALWVGHDLEEVESTREVRAHLETCEHCRAKSREYVVAQAALQEARCVPADNVPHLWPKVRARLAQWESRPQFAKFNVWVPTALATVACSLMIWVASVEVHRKLQSWPQTRNLYRTDEHFMATRGKDMSPRDVKRYFDVERRDVKSVSYPAYDE